MGAKAFAPTRCMARIRPCVSGAQTYRFSKRLRTLPLLFVRFPAIDFRYGQTRRECCAEGAGGGGCAWVSDELSIKPSRMKRNLFLIDGLIDRGPPQRTVSAFQRLTAPNHTRNVGRTVRCSREKSINDD